jgi:hypothetical protein
MRRIALALLMGLLLVADAGAAAAAIAFGTEAHHDDVGQSSTTVTITIHAQDTVVVNVLEDSGQHVSSITSCGGTLTQKASKASPSGDLIETWALLSASADTQCVINTTGTRLNASVTTYTGVAGFGTTVTTNGTGTTESVSLTTQDANNWIVAGFLSDANVTLCTIQNGTFRTTCFFSGQGHYLISAITNTSAAAGSVTGSFTDTGSGNWAAIALELRSTLGVAPVYRRATLRGRALR